MELLFDSGFQATTGQVATLCAEESAHCVRVLRHREGDNVSLTEGRGTLYTCQLLKADTKGCQLQVMGAERVAEPPHQLHMAVAPTKNQDRYEWFVEKAVELGVWRITPLVTERTVRVALRHDRLQRIAVAACKQSLKCHLPLIDEPTPLADLLRDNNAELNFLLHCEPGDKPHLYNKVLPRRSTLVLVGPEGDFTPAEIAQAEAARCVACTLGPERLRTETAAVAATNIVDLVNILSSR